VEGVDAADLLVDRAALQAESVAAGW
jgi:hypothetical protein